MSSPIFVFGSNLAGRHGAGAAFHALKYYGAKQGVAIGHIGNSYAIPTKDHDLHQLHYADVEHHISTFIAYAQIHQDLEFNVTQIGCGLAHFSPEYIAPLFRAAPSNCNFDPAWYKYLGDEHHYWKGPL